MRALLIGLAIAAGLGAGALAQGQRAPWLPGFRPTLPDEERVESLILERANDLRSAEGRDPVVESPQLTAAARSYARFLATARGGLSHTADGRDPGARATAAGYTYCEIAENLAFLQHSRGFETEALARQFVESWKGSPGHRRNLLLNDVTETGVGVVKAPERAPRYVAVQLFGRPLSLRYAFSVSNRSPRAVGYSFAGQRMLIEPRVTITHTACEHSPLVFEGGGGRFRPAGGQAYLLRSGRGGALQVEVGPTVEPPPPPGRPDRRR